jgi:pimeloyl-ACP methyl ester carboxylesterase
MLRHFTHDGLRLAYLDLSPKAGEATQAIVLVHGFASTHAVNWVNTRWTTTLANAGFRVVAMDNRGHGQSDKPHDPAAYDSAIMAEDLRALMDHLGLARAHVMGYSMGARIAAHLALAHPGRVGALLLGGLGIHLVDGVGLPVGIADAMEAKSLEELTDPAQRMFRAFADQNGQDRLALAACIRGSRQTMPVADVARIAAPTLISVGTNDPIAGPPEPLAELMPNARAFAIAGRDHNLAVGDRTHKEAVLAFLATHPIRSNS